LISVDKLNCIHIVTGLIFLLKQLYIIVTVQHTLHNFVTCTQHNISLFQAETSWHSYRKSIESRNLPSEYL